MSCVVGVFLAVQLFCVSAAKPGDRIYVTGELGASTHGLIKGSGRAWRRHLRPEPRIAEGRILRRLGVSAGMDLSDGLALDLYRLCLESKVSAEIDANLPIAPGASMDEVLHGGEDYELLFTAPPERSNSETLGRTPGHAVGLYHARTSWHALLSGATACTERIRSFSMSTQAGPEIVLDLIEAFRRSKTMFTAVRFGIFDQLEKNPQSAADLAAGLSVNASALARLLDGCVSLGLLIHEGETYRNTPGCRPISC